METCYRHPDRETRVSCSNCERPICPDCMTSTPVGMRCPECAKQKTRVTRGTASFGQSAAMPVTYFLIGVNVVAYLIELASGSGGLSGGGKVVLNYGLYSPAVADGEWYRLVTNGFLHANLLHIGLNMYFLWFLGQLLEPALGHVRFAVLYFACLLAGSLGVVVLEPNTLAVGASGAVFGLMAAGFVIARGRRIDWIATQLGILLVLNIVLSFGSARIAIGAHLFGAAAGLLAGLLVLAGDRESLGPNRVAVETAALAILGIVSFFAAIALA
jgi:membrane associated rhomboid family serine protease